MNFKNQINKSFILINRIRLSIFFFFLFIIISLFFNILSFYWTIFISILSLFFIFIFAFYIPYYFEKFSYILKNDYIILKYGVFFHKEILLNISLITKINLYQYPLSKIFKVQSISFSSSGSNIYIPCLNKQAIDNILKQIRKNDQ